MNADAFPDTLPEWPLPKQPCPAYGHRLNATSATRPGSRRQPRPGDETICLHCLTVLVFGPMGELQVEASTQISAQALEVQAFLQTHLRDNNR